MLLTRTESATSAYLELVTPDTSSSAASLGNVVTVSRTFAHTYIEKYLKPSGFLFLKHQSLSDLWPGFLSPGPQAVASAKSLSALGRGLRVPSHTFPSPKFPLCSVTIWAPALGAAGPKAFGKIFVGESLLETRGATTGDATRG